MIPGPRQTKAPKDTSTHIKSLEKDLAKAKRTIETLEHNNRNLKQNKCIFSVVIDTYEEGVEMIRKVWYYALKRDAIDAVNALACQIAKDYGINAPISPVHNKRGDSRFAIESSDGEKVASIRLTKISLK